MPKEETRTIDDCECVYCGHKFDGNDACNGNMDCQSVKCPECKKDMYVYLSIEYMCQPIEEDDEEDKV